MRTPNFTIPSTIPMLGLDRLADVQQWLLADQSMDSLMDLPIA